jgi:malonyl-CoA/methylmalonyl-CoA synthetase
VLHARTCRRVTIPAALDRRAAATPDALAIDDVSYAALRTGALRIATGLQRRGIGRGKRLVLYAENSHAFVLAYLGGLYAGAVVVPANVLYREADLARIIEDSGAEAVAVSAQSRPIAALTTARPLIGLDDIGNWAADESLPPLAADLPQPEDLALLIYTSGTTGRAKGAMLTHGNLAAIAEQVTTAWRWTSGDTLFLALPLFHIHGLCAGFNGSLFAGGRVLLRERFDAGDAVATLEAGHATMFFGVPTMYVRLLEQAPRATFERVRLFVSGSAALPASVHQNFERRFGASILERYGSTEFGFALTNRYEGPRHAGTVGFPFPGVAVKLSGPDGSEAGAGEIGEILVSGPNVCAGYWRNDEATSTAFVRDGAGVRWFRSGDLGSFDTERGYSIVGRIKELIISGGFNVYPLEVEEELLRVAGVRAAAVIGKPDPARGEIPVAFIEADEGVDEPALIDLLRTRLASFKVPKEIYRIDALPRNAMGKVDKPQLRSRLGDSAQDV